MVPPRWCDEQGRPLPPRPWSAMTPRGPFRLVTVLTTALLMGLFAACAAGRPTNLIRLREGYEVLTALRGAAGGVLHARAGDRRSAR